MTLTQLSEGLFFGVTTVLLQCSTCLIKTFTNPQWRQQVYQGRLKGLKAANFSVRPRNRMSEPTGSGFSNKYMKKRRAIFFPFSVES